MITLNLQGGPAHGRIIRVDWASPTQKYKVAVPPVFTKLSEPCDNPAVLIKEIEYRPVLNTLGKPWQDKHGYYYYEP